ncbi:MAG: universal stress protein [Polyangiales bacterium]
MFKKVIVGIDFTPKTDRAVGVAINLAKSTHGTTILVHVLPEATDEAHRASPGGDNDAMLHIEERLQQISARPRDHHAHVDYGVVRGRAAEELISYVHKGGDVIVAASEARRGLDRLNFLGSVAERLQLSPVPVPGIQQHRPRRPRAHLKTSPVVRRLWGRRSARSPGYSSLYPDLARRDPEDARGF